MPRIEPELQRLQDIKSLPSLIKYLKDDLHWPIESDDVDEVAFDYDPAELGFDSESTAKIEEVRQLRPLTAGQKWGIFWVKFSKKRLPVQMLRRALANLVVKKRASSRRADKAAWHMHDLLFISAYGDDSNRHVTFAHFSGDDDAGKSLPVLKVLGWDEEDTVLHLRDAYKTLLAKLDWKATPTDNPDAWREQWSSAFKVGHREVINTTKELVVELAHLATVIKKSVLTSINAETDKGPWKKLMLAFQKTLIKDLNEEQFADVIAQTVSYGLLTARLSSDGQISLKNLVDMVPSTNPFLKELLQHFLTSAGMKGLFDVDEAGINDVVELLNRSNAQAIRNDFGKKTDGEDPVIHFYEHFLGAYNKKLKVERGVFYTPRPIVSYIVRSVHELLQKEFGLEDGLADTSSWAEVKGRHKDLKVPDGIKPDIEPFVQILDPATGTATFLIEVIDVIHSTMTAKWDKERLSKAEQVKKWNTYVPTHLLPRIYAYELMMAPYAIAHMKVGLKLTETGFTAWEKLGSESRANIFLTNALEPWSSQLVLPGFDALAHEAAAVNEIKKHKSFTVIIGNPPYSNFGQLNKNTFILSLLDDYKRGLDEQKLNLDDDYIKFVKYCQHLIDGASTGIFGMITNNVFFDGVTHRRMRESLRGTFTNLRVLDLHGSTKKLEAAPDGSKDENVFDIQQGVGISIFSRLPYQVNSTIVFSELWGRKENKYGELSLTTSLSKGGIEVLSSSPYHFIVPKNFSEQGEWDRWQSIREIMPVNASGVKTHLDDVFVGFTKAEITSAIDEYVKINSSNAPINQTKRASPERKANLLKNALKNCQAKPIQKYAYRAMDNRLVFYVPEAIEAGDHRYPVMRHLVRDNLALVTVRQLSQGHFTHAFVTRSIADMCLLSTATKECAYIFPLHLETGDGLPGVDSSSTNLSIPTQTYLQKAKSTPESFLHYAYALLHSPKYRHRYTEFLKIDFPRLPLTENFDLYHVLSRLGREISLLHLLELPKIDSFITQFLGDRTPPIEKVSWSANTVWIDKAQIVGFKGVTEEVWRFHVGGYQVCEKWLKDRKGRKLTKDDIEHYQKIVVALSETIRLMAEIDKVIDEHGGWPSAFHTQITQ